MLSWLEAASDRQFLDYLDVEGTVYAPGGETLPVRLRQTAPGRYETTIDASAPGNYVVVETDPDGYTSSGDVQGNNDNQIAVTLIPELHPSLSSGNLFPCPALPRLT